VSKQSADKWLKSGKYLPAPLQDFHDQKAVFKTMHELIDVEGHEYAKPVDWITGQCYVIDIFLWFMARRGWTLQRTRKQYNFKDLDADVAEQGKKRSERLMALIQNHTKEHHAPRPDH